MFQIKNMVSFKMKKTYIIAEIGINHNGSLEIAKKLIDVAAVSGCDAVKFQKRNPDVCVPEHQKSVMRDTPWGRMTYLDYKYKVEFEKEEYLSRSKIIKKVIPFAQKHIENDGRLWQISRHILNLIENIPHAKILRQELSEKCQTQKADVSILKKIAQQLEDAGQ